ncbi:MAG: minor capsid protein, partial [Oscillospiraceae bacterium]|nr:minor capsid protein [Oscillospiraceae bacterium]
MPAQVEIIDMLSDAAVISKIGLLSPAVDLAMNFAGGKTVKPYLDGSALMTMNVQISGKGADQMKVANRLCEICDTITHRNFRTFPKTDKWEIRRITVGTPPAPKGLDEDGTWFYACIIS